MNILKMFGIKDKYRIKYDPTQPYKYKIERKSWIPFYWDYVGMENNEEDARKKLKQGIQSKMISEDRIKSKKIIPISYEETEDIEREVLMEGIVENISEDSGKRKKLKKPKLSGGCRDLKCPSEHFTYSSISIRNELKSKKDEEEW